MNVTLKLTMAGLIEALRWKALDHQAASGQAALKPTTFMPVAQPLKEPANDQ